MAYLAERKASIKENTIKDLVKAGHKIDGKPCTEETIKAKITYNAVITDREESCITCLTGPLKENWEARKLEIQEGMKDDPVEMERFITCQQNRIDDFCKNIGGTTDQDAIVKARSGLPKISGPAPVKAAAVGKKLSI